MLVNTKDIDMLSIGPLSKSTALLIEHLALELLHARAYMQDNVNRDFRDRCERPRVGDLVCETTLVGFKRKGDRVGLLLRSDKEKGEWVVRNLIDNEADRWRNAQFLTIIPVESGFSDE